MLKIGLEISGLFGLVILLIILGTVATGILAAVKYLRKPSRKHSVGRKHAPQPASRKQAAKVLAPEGVKQPFLLTEKPAIPIEIKDPQHHSR